MARFDCMVSLRYLHSYRTDDQEIGSLTNILPCGAHEKEFVVDALHFRSVI